MTTIFSSSKATIDLGSRFGARLRSGDVIGLIGPLGAGKTTLVRGMAQGLQVTAGYHVTSPTFVFAQVYPGEVPLYHIDLYRVRDQTDLATLGIDEMVGQDGVAVIEWFDRFPDIWTGNRFEIRMAFLGESERQLELVGLGERASKIVSTMDLAGHA